MALVQATEKIRSLMDHGSARLRHTGATVLSGALVGALGALFLKSLQLADAARVAVIEAAARRSIPDWVAGATVGAVGVSVAVWMAARHAPDSPQLSEPEKPDDGQERTSNPAALTVNFAGTSLAVGAGLALGPERPAIQMGGAIGRLTSRIFRLGEADREILVAAIGGAGVATMFNSPLGCAAYTVESVLKRVNFRISATALGAGAMAVAVARGFTGRDVNFRLGELPAIRSDQLFWYLLLGGVVAVLANLHVRLTKALDKGLHRLRLPRVVRGGLVGGIIGWLAWYSPGTVGTGDSLTQGVLDGGFTLSVMAVFFGARFFLGPLSLAAGTPGGYFTPVLLLGALLGSMGGTLVDAWVPSAGVSPTSMALVGMAVALAGIARAPFTGILLVMETTGAYPIALATIIGVLGAVAVNRLLSMRMPRLSNGLEAVLAPAIRRHHASRNPRRQMP